MAYMHAQFTVV